MLRSQLVKSKFCRLSKNLGKFNFSSLGKTYEESHE